MLQINNIKITNGDIIYAEKVLLKEGQNFDIERRDFIKNLDTIDLQAVPGSGKTTALLAKLLILERKMPFPDGSGILVLSHTNTAVDEIKERIGKVAPKLFDFPNFIGTIQEFVNKFLAKPYGVNYLGIKFQHIDSEYYENKCYIGYNGWLDRRGDKDNIIKKSIKKGDKLFYPDGSKFPLSDNTKPLYTKILDMKSLILAEGIISYEEAYFYGNLYIEKYPHIKKILQNRFNYIFVDEMQDMGIHQVNILEKIFYDNGDGLSVIQRVGDTNQAIYDGIVTLDKTWKGRDEITGNTNDKLKIVGSHRFTEKISDVVKCFGLDNYELNGFNEIKDDSDTDISVKPIMIIYNNNHLNNSESDSIMNDNKIIQRFSEIIKDKKNNGYFSGMETSKFSCKAIIWNAKPRDGNFNIDKCRAKHYFYDYDVTANKSKNKIWFKNYKDYLYYYDKVSNSYKSKYDNLINLFLSILRDNEVKNPLNQRNFNKASLLRYLKENDEQVYIDLKSKLYNWSKKLTDSNIDDIAEEIELYFPSLISALPGTQSNPLIIKDSDISEEGIEIDSGSDNEKNLYSNNGIDIKVCNVHSVKGETHTCTLYLESSNKNKYETDFCSLFGDIGDLIELKNNEIIILEQKIIELAGARGTPTRRKELNAVVSEIDSIKKSSKMLYVGLSRPTHLLCYAIHKDRYDKLIEGDGNEGKLKELWDVDNSLIS